MNLKKPFIALFTVAIMFAASTVSLACACCAERGQYDVSTDKIDAYRLGVIKDIKFNGKADLYTTAGEFEAIRGLAVVESEYAAGVTGDFNIVDLFTNKTWSLTIKTPGGKSGVLMLPMPTSMKVRRIDTHEKGEETGEISVYKEFQFNGPVKSGTGIFKTSISTPATYSLIFQGRGNNCDNAEDFKNWRLEINGKNARFAFFGTTGT